MGVVGVTAEVRIPATEGEGTSLGTIGGNILGSNHRIADDHTEALSRILDIFSQIIRSVAYLLERGDLLVIRGLDVVDSHTAVWRTNELVGHLRNTNQAAVGVLEVQNGSPVVR